MNSSSRMVETIEQKRTRSRSGCSGSAASSSTRSTSASDESSRFSRRSAGREPTPGGALLLRLHRSRTAVRTARASGRAASAAAMSTAAVGMSRRPPNAIAQSANQRPTERHAADHVREPVQIEEHAARRDRRRDRDRELRSPDAVRGPAACARGRAPPRRRRLPLSRSARSGTTGRASPPRWSASA